MLPNGNLRPAGKFDSDKSRNVRKGKVVVYQVETLAEPNVEAIQKQLDAP